MSEPRNDPRVEPSYTGDERTTLLEFLDWYRLTIEQKVAGMTDEQALVASGPGGTTALGLVRHLTEVERGWFRRRFAGTDAPYRWLTEADPDADWRVGPGDSLADALTLYRDECAHSRAVVDSAASLDDLAGSPMRDGTAVNLRWIVVHMIEETARHAGHLDILREQIDGTLGE